MNRKNKLTCICHYEGQSFYGEINELSDLNIKRLQEAKKKREELGGDHLHSHQIQQLPGKFNKESHGIHSKPWGTRGVNPAYHGENLKLP